MGDGCARTCSATAGRRLHAPAPRPRRRRRSGAGRVRLRCRAGLRLAPGPAVAATTRAPTRAMAIVARTGRAMDALRRCRREPQPRPDGRQRGRGRPRLRSTRRCGPRTCGRDRERRCPPWGRRHGGLARRTRSLRHRRLGSPPQDRPPPRPAFRTEACLPSPGCRPGQVVEVLLLVASPPPPPPVHKPSPTR